MIQAHYHRSAPYYPDTNLKKNVVLFWQKPQKGKKVNTAGKANLEAEVDLFTGAPLLSAS